MRIDKNKLTLALARRCMNLRALREVCGMSPQTLARVNAGEDVLPGTAGKIARALGVDVTELLPDKED